MKNKLESVAGLCVLAFAVCAAVLAPAPTSEVKEKPPMYSYVGFWAIAGAQWADIEKQTVASQKVMEKASAGGSSLFTAARGRFRGQRSTRLVGLDYRVN